MKIAPLILVIIVTNVLTYCISTTKFDLTSNKTDIQLYQDTVKITSKIIERKQDFSQRPSYTIASAYTISHNMNKYCVLLPGGSIVDCFSTIQEAQIEINDRAKSSYDRWINSGGYDY